MWSAFTKSKCFSWCLLLFTYVFVGGLPADAAVVAGSCAFSLELSATRAACVRRTLIAVERRRHRNDSEQHQHQ